MGTRTVYLENRQEELKAGLEKLLSVHDFALTEEKRMPIFVFWQSRVKKKF